MTVLVAYATAHGSTRGVAERLATRLSERGHRAVAASVDDIDDLAPYDAVIVGSAIHEQAWLPKATWFLTDHADELAKRPVWLFSVGMPAAVARPLRRLALREGVLIERELAGIVPIQGHRLYSGVVSRDTFPQSSSRLIFRLMGCRYGDFRDWQSIDQWAARIADVLDERASANDTTDAGRRQEVHDER